MISPDSIEEVKARIDIVDIVSNYVQLKKAGNSHKACCPFHSEKTPSFVVSDAKQIYHCFGCGVHGDGIKFVMELEKLSYIETIEKLANEYNITLQKTISNAPFVDISIIDKINSYYKNSFSHNKTAVDYVKKRGVSEHFIEKFQIGYVGNFDEFMNFLSRDKINLDDAFKIGILRKNQNGSYYSVFRERIMFPILSPQGKIVGFGGRTITGHDAKYINSPQSMIFNKSRLLYGYYQARDSIIKKDLAIVTEGYLDVVLLHQGGFENSIATLGTALTKEHIPILSKLTKNIILAYDGDKAGRMAAYKAILLTHNDFTIKVALFDEGCDPADLIADDKINKIVEIFDEAQDGIEFALKYIVNKYDLLVSSQKQQAYEEAMVFFKSLHIVMQNDYKAYLCDLLKIDISVIKTKNEAKKTQKIVLAHEDLAELSVLKTALCNNELFVELLDCVEDSYFFHHKLEFLAIKKDTKCEQAFKIMLRDDIEELDYENFYKQIINLSIRFYQNLKKRTFVNDADFKIRSKVLREIEDILKDLRKSKLPNISKDNILKYFDI